MDSFTFQENSYSFKGHSYKVACATHSSQHPSWYSFEDESSVRDAMWDVRPGACVFDVGAAYGSYTLTALAAGATRVFAWSPQGEPGIPHEREFLAESLRRNGWADRVTTYGTGVYDRDGWLNAMTQEFSVEPPTSFNNDVIQVGRLDSWYENDFVPNESKNAYSEFWLKLDVEGAEVDVLRAATHLIGDLRPHIQVENHNFKRATIEAEVRAVLTGLGYREIVTNPYHAVSHSLYKF